MGVELYTKAGDHDEVSALKKHGVRWRLRGLPIFDEDTDYIIGITTEPEWEWSDLTPEQRIFLESKAKTDAKTHSATYDLAIWATAGDYGVSCPHRWITHEEVHLPPYKECARCRAWVQLPGRVVQVGDEVMRVPDPPPLRLVVPVRSTVSAVNYTALKDPTPANCTIETIEYMWTGTTYERVS